MINGYAIDHKRKKIYLNTAQINALKTIIGL